MASFTKGSSAARAPFGRPQILRSTKFGSFGEKSYTISSALHPAETIDGKVEKILYPGEVIAAITSGPQIGKFGVRQLGVTDGRQDIANVVGVSKDFFLTELLNRDVEAAVFYYASLIQVMCTERDAGGLRVALPNATADALYGKKALQLLFS